MIKLHSRRGGHLTTPTAFDPSYRFSTSWLLPPLALFLVRLLFSAYFFLTIVIDWALTSAAEVRQSFSFFTQLTFFGLAFYALFAAVHTATYWRRGRPALAGWPRALQEAHGVLYTTVVVFPFLVTIVFWALIYAGPLPTAADTWSNTTKHALNSLLALAEILLPRTLPMPWWHIAPLVLILAGYLGVAYLTRATQGFYTYAFLDPAAEGSGRGKVAGYILGILAGAVVVFLLVRGAVWLRVWVTERKMGRVAGVRSKRDVGPERVEMREGMGAQKV